MKTATSYLAQICLPLTLLLASCGAQAVLPETLPPLKTALDCMPEAGAITASHRGTSRDWATAENSISGLKKLIEENYLIAEIDVARLRDGTYITFHDGVWDEVSTGKGPIASTTKAGLDKILLKTRRGKLTADRPPSFENMLNTAKGKIYLEIDFKSSANMDQIIERIRKADMGQHVLLIAYSAKQAKRLRKLAPDMLLSAPQNAAKNGELIWLGKDIKDRRRITSIRNSKQYAIGRVGKALDERDLTTARVNADILVTDYPNQYLPLTGLNRAERQAFGECLAKAL